ncbi:MAG: ABC transporter ATP-binding protein [Holophagales bacterium]|nr:ABC transporter ATP-binding protein [Holophagales bacterium]
MPGEPLLVAESLARGFGEGEARLELFSGLSLTLGVGDAVAIVGPSGCGKSTLLHLLAGLDRPDAGRVAVDGRDWETLAPEPKAKWRGESVGFVFQLHHLLPELTAEENVALPLFLAGVGDSAARASARELLARVGLVRQAGSLPRVLSGGERQRVAIARAVVRRPRLLLCDEPTGSLDAAHAADVLELLLGTARERAGALLLVTHDPGVAARCGTVLTLSPGGLAAS